MGRRASGPRHHVPVRIAFVQDTLPRNANGKILKKDLGAFFA